MTGAISSINSASVSSSAQSSQSSSISEDTKKKLKALGLDPDKYNTEAAAQQAIQEKQAQQSQQSQPKPQGNSTMETIENNAKSLASQIGVSVGNSDKLDDIFDKISTKVDELEASAGTDSTKKTQADGYNTQYTNLKNELTQAKSAMQMTGASAMANYNKVALGLA